MPVEDIPSMLQMIEEKIAASEIGVQHRDTLIRLSDNLEEDLKATDNDDGTNRHMPDNQRTA